jgi:hypothetical protein
MSEGRIDPVPASDLLGWTAPPVRRSRSVVLVSAPLFEPDLQKIKRKFCVNQNHSLVHILSFAAMIVRTAGKVRKAF